MTVHYADAVSLINRCRNSGQTPTSSHLTLAATDGREAFAAVCVR
jgi:hypothetical protein